MAQLQREGHVVVDGHVGVEGVVLEDHGDVAVLGGDIVDAAVADVEVALGDLLQPGDHAQRRRLAAARRPHQHQELVVNDLQIQVANDGGARCVGFGDVLKSHLSHVRLP